MIVAGIMEEIGGIPLDELGIGEALQVDGALNITEGEAIDSADLNLSDHAAKRIAERNITESDIKETMQQNPFRYYHGGEWKTGYYDPEKRLFVGQAENGKITTVIRDANQNYIDNIMRRRS